MRAPVERMGKSLNRFVDVSGLKKVGDAFGWIGRTAMGAFRSIAMIVPALGAITSAATIAGMAKLVSNFAKWENVLRLNARSIGMSETELQKWQDATTRAGGSAEDMATTLQSLHKISVQAFTGMNTEALAYFNRFGINLRDANGNLKTATQLLPEVFAALDKLKDPADRARVASALLGDEQAKLYETYKISGKSLQQWLALEEKHEHLTQAQLDSLNNYRLAMDGLTTTFDQLGRQISATMAQAFTPMVKAFDEWVQQHEPEIEAKVKELSATFSEFMGSVDWKEVAAGVGLVARGLGVLLQTMLEVGRALGQVLRKFADLFALKNIPITKADVLNNTHAYSTLSDEQKAALRKQLNLPDEEPEGPEGKANPNPFHWWNPGSWNRGESYFDRTMKGPAALRLRPDDKGRAADIRDRLAKDLNLTQDQAAGVVGNLQAESGLKAVNETNPTVPGSQGGFGWAQWTGSRRDDFNRYVKATGLDPKSDEANYGFLVQEMKSPEYAGMMAHLHASKTPSGSAAVVESEYERPAVRNTGVRQGYADQIAAAPSAPPVAAPQTASINGSVDVSITHRNPPPDASVSAKSSGAVNVAPLRKERPQVDFADA